LSISFLIYSKNDNMFSTPKFVSTKKSLARYAALSYPRKQIRLETINAADGRTIEIQCSSMKELINEIIAVVTIGGTQA
jgi:D-amino peptidase